MPFVPVGLRLIGELLRSRFPIHPHAGSKAKAGAVRFAPSQPSEGNPGHVHFDEKLRDSAVMVTQERDGHVLVKVLAGLWGAVLRCGVLAEGGTGELGVPKAAPRGPVPFPRETEGFMVPRCHMKQGELQPSVLPIQLNG